MVEIQNLFVSGSSKSITGERPKRDSSDIIIMYTFTKGRGGEGRGDDLG